MSRFFDDKVLSDDQICEETCENGQVSPESRYNDYRNRLPFHYIEDGENDGYYYWTYGATMELSIILSDDVACGEDPQPAYDIFVDDELSETSKNPVQNKVITEALNGKVDKSTEKTVFDQAYIKTAAGDNSRRDISIEQLPLTLVERDIQGHVMTSKADSEGQAVPYEQFIQEQDQRWDNFNLENGENDYSLQQKNGDHGARATGINAVAFGGKYYLKENQPNIPTTIAAGIQSFAANGSNEVYGAVAAGFGKENKVYGKGSFVEGGGNIDRGVVSGLAFNHIEGTTNNVEGNVNHVEGSRNEIISLNELGENCQPDIANFLHIEGLSNSVPARELDKAITVHVEGQGNTVTGNIVHVEGLQNTSSGNVATHIEGSYNTVSKATASHVAGQGNNIQNVTNSYISGQGNNIQKGTGIYIFGNNCVSTGDWSYSTGYNTRAGKYSFSGGQYTNAEALASFAVNTATYAEMPYSAAFGNTTRTRRESQFACGEFTNENAKYATRALLVVGNGTKDAHSNAFEVLKDGRARVYGIPEEENDILRFQDVTAITEAEIDALFVA